MNSHQDLKNLLSHKQMDTHGCLLSRPTVATDALVIKLQAISTHSAD